MFSKKRANAGFSLMEILVTLLIIAVAFLGLAAAQSASLRQSQATYFRSQASLIITSIVEKMRANVGGLQNDFYLISSGVAPTGNADACVLAVCDSAAIAASDLVSVYNRTINALPAGQLEIIRISDDILRVRLRWDERRNGAVGTGCQTGNENDLICLAINLDIGDVGA